MSARWPLTSPRAAHGAAGARHRPVSPVGRRVEGVATLRRRLRPGWACGPPARPGVTRRGPSGEERGGSRGEGPRGRRLDAGQGSTSCHLHGDLRRLAAVLLVSGSARNLPFPSARNAMPGWQTPSCVERVEGGRVVMIIGVLSRLGAFPLYCFLQNAVVVANGVDASRRMGRLLRCHGRSMRTAWLLRPVRQRSAERVDKIGCVAKFIIVQGDPTEGLLPGQPS